MDIKNYLIISGMTQAEFARQIGCSENAVSLWVRHMRRPTLEMAKRIIALTNGVVTADGLYIHPYQDHQSV